MRWQLCQSTHYCFLLLPLSLLGPFELPLLIVPAVLLPLQPLMLVLLIAVIPVEDKRRMTSPSSRLTPLLSDAYGEQLPGFAEESSPIFSTPRVEKGVAAERKWTC